MIAQSRRPAPPPHYFTTQNSYSPFPIATIPVNCSFDAAAAAVGFVDGFAEDFAVDDSVGDFVVVASLVAVSVPALHIGAYGVA